MLVPMESVFLACFLFGALFTVASAVLGSVGHGPGEAHDAGLAGHLHASVHIGHAHGPHVPHVANGHGGPAGHPHAPHGVGADGETLNGSAGVFGALRRLPVLGFSSLVAFLTWFGAAGYATLRYAGWALPGAVAVAALAGVAGALLVATFLGRVLAGERVMDAREYRLPGTIARVTVGIPASGVGEIVFSKAGSRRSEAARSATGRPIARGTEVVIMDYGQGTARVQPWEELLADESHRRDEAQGRLPAAEMPADPGV